MMRPPPRRPPMRSRTTSSEPESQAVPPGRPFSFHGSISRTAHWQDAGQEIPEA